jgi:hypothetical protein
VSLFSKFVTRSRIRKAARKLADDPCAKNYVALAREQVASGDMDQVSRVCTEGLQLHPDCAELQRLAERARHLKYEARAQTLQEELAVSPRPALWRELCQLMLEMGRVDRADKAAHDWYRTTKDGEALYFRALAHAERFYTDRRAEQGQIAHDLAREAQKLCKTDPRPIKLQLEITTRAGAWQDSRRLLARLLELLPGDPALEGRFRAVHARCDKSKDLLRGLSDVERSGAFADDESEQHSSPAQFAVRPMLKELGADSGVRAAIYLRGGTALVQGPRGATAERTARAVRELVQSSRRTVRRIGLGTPVEVLLEGAFGSLLVSPGEQSTSALWCNGPVKHKHEELLKDLSGMADLSTRGVA